MYTTQGRSFPCMESSPESLGFFSSLKTEMMPSGRKKTIAAHIDRASEDVTFVSDLCLSFIASVIELTIHSVAASAKASMNVCIH